ncbi:hypothetical protein [Streptomyces sp. NPDC057748]|uniref:hypothetical protein n=1 Tax=unclassified Streptomyces TaxID=2593676 RepID=UPI0036B009B9
MDLQDLPGPLPGRVRTAQVGLQPGGHQLGGRAQTHVTGTGPREARDRPVQVPEGLLVLRGLGLRAALLARLALAGMGDQLAGLTVGVRELREQPGRPVRRGGGQRVLALPLGRRHERPRRSRARLPLADRDPGPHPQRPHQRRDIAQLAPQLPGPCVRQLRLRAETSPVERLRGRIRQHRVVVLLGPARAMSAALRRPVQPEQPAAELMAGMGPERPALARLVRPVRGVQPLLDRLGELPGTGEDFGEPQTQPGPPARRDERGSVLQRGPCRPFRPLVLLQLGGEPGRLGQVLDPTAYQDSPAPSVSAAARSYRSSAPCGSPRHRRADPAPPRSGWSPPVRRAVVR